MDCDKDCFNCKFPDCVASQRHICRANTKPKEKKQKCDRDCFNCKFEDCILTETEAAIMEIQEPTYEDIPKKKTDEQIRKHNKYLKNREHYLQKAKKHYIDNKEFYSEYEKAYREKKQKEEPGYYTAKSQRHYYKLKADPVKWEEYQRKKREYYQRKKELENGKVI